MMKKRITWKLTVCFGIVLILFSLLTGSVFIFLYRKNTIYHKKENLRKQAVEIAATYQDCLELFQIEETEQRDWYLSFLDKLTLTDVWIVDSDYHIISHEDYQWDSLPPEVRDVILRVMEGEETFCAPFSEILGKSTLTMGTPIQDSEGNILGAVLLHTSVHEVDTAVSQGFQILGISNCIALVAAVFLSARMSCLFSKPLEKMKSTIQELAQGNYDAKTGVTSPDEIGQMAVSLDRLADRLKDVEKEGIRLEQTRRDFIASVSHELRTPVTVLRGSVEALRDGVITQPDEIAKYRDQMLAECVYLERLVNDLLEMSRLQNPDFNIEMSPINLSDALADVVRSMRRVASKKGITITAEISEPECWIQGDYGRIRQMMAIVIDNSIKFSEEGMTVMVQLYLENHHMAVVNIVDKGCGISSKLLPHIFDRFQKADSESNKCGTGLGLPIAKQIALRHQVEIGVSSIPYEKTVFQFQFQLLNHLVSYES